MDSTSILLVSVTIISSITAVSVILRIAWAVITGKDRSYKEKRNEFLDRKRRVEQRIQENNKNAF